VSILFRLVTGLCHPSSFLKGKRRDLLSALAKLQAQEAMEEAKTQERQQRAAERAAKRAGAQQVRKKSLHAYVCFIASCS